ncbi:SDR family NAD(P)-dependent oxidoreductase [Henriciella litoralis]|uniref:SDR family NAD(P)-dependent oxidoreductase n=1 Tax=Henriciella litoralis TaxID=568102 RepID=UPI000A068D35|nr:SDR family NAD(P)-dependent oxidoreductase [Henriciella litoralis]
MSHHRQIEGKVALVTGANRGLGAAIVEHLLALGASKVYCGARNLNKMDAVLDRFGPRAESVALDVTNTDQVNAAARALTEVDLLVSNAGVTYMVPLSEVTLDGARATMETNYFGPLRLVQAFAKSLNKRQGGFIYILSLAALTPAHDAELYSASKAAGTMLGHAVRHAYPNIGVTLSYPGLMDTDMMRDTPLVKTSPEEIARQTLEGWIDGRVSVFPDLHASLLRDAILNSPESLLGDPYELMTTALTAYMKQRPFEGN